MSNPLELDIVRTRELREQLETHEDAIIDAACIMYEQTDRKKTSYRGHISEIRDITDTEISFLLEDRDDGRDYWSCKINELLNFDPEAERKRREAEQEALDRKRDEQNLINARGLVERLEAKLGA